MSKRGLGMEDLIMLTDETCSITQKKKVETIQVNYKFIKRMNRIEGQTKGIKNMMTRKTYCDDNLHQI
jgi:CsoR family transcriptional regulator, copper-sensing transcriptional repressor